MPSAGTSIRAVGGLPSAGLGNATGETFFVGSGPTPSTLVLQIPQSGEFANRPLRFKVGGRLSMGVTGTFDLRVYIGTGGPILTANKLFDTGAISCTGNGNFLVLVDTFWDSLSKTFCGVGYGEMLNTLVDLAALSNAVSADPNGSIAVPVPNYTAQALVSGQFGSSNAANTAFVDLFEADS